MKLKALTIDMGLICSVEIIAIFIEVEWRSVCVDVMAAEILYVLLCEIREQYRARTQLELCVT